MPTKLEFTGNGNVTVSGLDSSQPKLTCPEETWKGTSVLEVRLTVPAIVSDALYVACFETEMEAGLDTNELSNGGRCRPHANCYTLRAGALAPTELANAFNCY